MFVIQCELTDEIIAMVDGMTKEFNDKDGCVTCEFSIQEKYVVAMHRYIHKKNPELPKGIWRVYLCETCVEYHGPNSYHVDILNLED